MSNQQRKRNLPIACEMRDDSCAAFEYRDARYGVIHFTVCPVRKARKLKEVWIHTNQRDPARAYVVRPDNKSGLYFSFATTELMRMVWCLDHKTWAFDVYPPKDSNGFQIGLLPSFTTIYWLTDGKFTESR